MDAIVYDTATGEWSGELPPGCDTRVQWLDKGKWVPEKGLDTRERDDGLRVLSRAIRRGPLKYDKYRLVQSGRSGIVTKSRKRRAAPPDTSEGSNMNNPFRAGTDRAKVFDILRDGKPRTQKEVDAEYGEPVHRSAMWGIHMAGEKNGYKLVRGEKRKMWIEFEDGSQASAAAEDEAPPEKAAPADDSPKPAKKGEEKKAKPAKAAKPKKAKKAKKEPEVEAKPAKPKKAKKAKPAKKGKPKKAKKAKKKSDRVRL